MKAHVVTTMELSKFEWPPDRRSVFQSQDWLVRSPRIGRERHIVIKDGSKIRSLLPVFILSNANYAYHCPKHLLCAMRDDADVKQASQRAGLAKILEKSTLFPAAVSISPYGYRSGLIGDIETAQLVLDALDDLCRNERVGLLSHFFLNEDDDRQWIDKLIARRGVPQLAGADCVMPIKWQNMNEYYRSLGPRGSKLRTSSRNTINTEGAIWQSVGRLDESDIEPAIRLLAAGFRGHGHADPPYQLFRSLLTEWPGEQIISLGRNDNGDIKSLLMTFVSSDVFYPKFFGAKERSGDYFFLTFSELIAQAISRGISRIEFGGGSHESKLLRGADLRWLVAIHQVYDRELEAVLRPYWRIINSNEYKFFDSMCSKFHHQNFTPPLPKYLSTMFN